MKQHAYLVHSSFMTDDELMACDIWQAQDIGLKPDTVSSTYQLNFSHLKPYWFKHVVKQFIRFQASTKSFASCYSYLGRLKHFCDFLMDKNPSIEPSQINRPLIVHYIAYLSKSHLGTVTRNMALIHLRTLHGIILQEKWLPWPNEPLIFSSDLAKPNQKIPRYIPEYVLSQLQQKLHHLPVYMQHLITVLLETGRRVGEVCTLPFHCLEQDEQGDYFLKVVETKLKRDYLIPISETCIKTIKAQQALVEQGLFENKQYLFATRRKHKSAHVSARYVNHALNQLAKEQCIVDSNGQLWSFHSHQFRHTVGTRMINAGVPQTIVQKYLGHESPEMTSRYAHIHDETLKAAFNDYQGKLVDVTGHQSPSRTIKGYDDAKWLQYNIMSQALPNGLCALPSPQQACPHANACLTCVHFRTHKTFLPQHYAQLKTTNELIESAKHHGWQRQAEMNQTVKVNLEKIIQALENKSS